ncbi:MAG: nuclear transport factor 2 family protein [Proteobacteria bacterium]|nr:nuclear transport factor 2 family protein [Pseudomonadota bacterium]
MSKQDIATQIIYQYASMLDAKNFSDLPTIMWNDFSLTGPYELNSLEIFMGAVEQNLGAYQKTMHFIGNIEGEWHGDIYTGKTYCIASHMFAENGQSKKLDMGIIYDDTIELREGVAKFINRHFNLQWQKTDLLN